MRPGFSGKALVSITGDLEQKIAEATACAVLQSIPGINRTYTMYNNNQFQDGPVTSVVVSFYGRLLPYQDLDMAKKIIEDKKSAQYPDCGDIDVIHIKFTQ